MSVKIPYKPESTATYETESRRAAVELQLLPGLYRVQWTNTLTGDVEDGGVVEAADSTITLTSPEFAADIALRLTRTRDSEQ
ncbi:MAG TPA: hypothetical protein PJ982_01310 [Lacipirellulaceae bacterium]|nr:hypothetical protein [Lacipirellulaceae bacterium]